MYAQSIRLNSSDSLLRRVTRLGRWRPTGPPACAARSAAPIVARAQAPIRLFGYTSIPKVVLEAKDRVATAGHDPCPTLRPPLVIALFGGSSRLIKVEQ